MRCIAWGPEDGRPTEAPPQANVVWRLDFITAIRAVARATGPSVTGIKTRRAGIYSREGAPFESRLHASQDAARKIFRATGIMATSEKSRAARRPDKSRREIPSHSFATRHDSARVTSIRTRYPISGSGNKVRKPQRTTHSATGFGRSVHGVMRSAYERPCRNDWNFLLWSPGEQDL
jgi:hypothetical protein